MFRSNLLVVISWLLQISVEQPYMLAVQQLFPPVKVLEASIQEKHLISKHFYTLCPVRKQHHQDVFANTWESLSTKSQSDRSLSVEHIIQWISCGNDYYVLPPV